jgi:hypothetical protein
MKKLLAVGSHREASLLRFEVSRLTKLGWDCDLSLAEPFLPQLCSINVLNCV